MARPKKLNVGVCADPEGCDRPAEATGLCMKHYLRIYNRRPERKTQDRAYRQRPEVKERDRLRCRRDRAKGKAIVRERKYRASAKGRATRAAYLASAEGKAMRYGVCARYNKRRAERLRDATPAWVDKDVVQQIYEKCPPGMWVDHILPLFGETVCGLHVPENLQYLTPMENSLKWNKVSNGEEE